MYKYIITWVLTQWVSVPCNKEQDFLGRNQEVVFSVLCQEVQSIPKMYITENKIQALTTLGRINSARNFYYQNNSVKDFIQDPNDKTISITNIVVDSIQVK